MRFSEFPIETNEAKTEVTLPIGIHCFRLVVTDDAGTVSRPDTVMITVKEQAEPSITYIEPAAGQRGQHLDAVIIGHGLAEVTAIKVFREGQEDHRVTVTWGEGVTNEKVPVRIKILDHAGLGQRILEVTTTHGSATVAFGVISAAEPRILDLTPRQGPLGLPYNMPVRIEGDDLEKTTEVVFWHAEQKDEQLKAKIRRATAEYVDIDLWIAPDAALGQRTFTVTTPAGTAASPPALTFQVVPGYVQIGIIALTLVTALIHLALRLPDLLFILNGLGYMALLAGLYWPVQQLWGVRAPIRWGLLVYTIITILAWLVLGDKQMALGYITKVVELALIGLLLVENYQATRKTAK